MTQIDMPVAGSESNSLTPFQFDGRNVRLIDRDGEFWFVASDVAAELGYDHTPSLVRLLDDDEKGVHNLHTLGGAQDISLISEAGLYRAIVQRRATKKMDEKLKARLSRFQRWVFHDVLPSIRKTGSYEVQPSQSVTVEGLLANPEQLLVLAQGYALQIEDMKREMVVMQQDVKTLDRISGVEDLFGIRVTAKLLQMQERKFTAWVQQNGWAYRQPNTKTLLCYADKMKAGLATNKMTPYTKPDGSEGVRETLRFTAKGVVKMGKMLGVNITEGDLYAERELAD